MSGSTKGFKSPALAQATSVSYAEPRRVAPTGILHFTLAVTDLDARAGSTRMWSAAPSGGRTTPPSSCAAARITSCCRGSGYPWHPIVAATP